MNPQPKPRNAYSKESTQNSMLKFKSLKNSSIQTMQPTKRFKFHAQPLKSPVNCEDNNIVMVENQTESLNFRTSRSDSFSSPKNEGRNIQDLYAASEKAIENEKNFSHSKNSTKINSSCQQDKGFYHNSNEPMRQ